MSQNNIKARVRDIIKIKFEVREKKQFSRNLYYLFKLFKIMRKPRVGIPINVQESLELADIIKNKHQADGQLSPLNALSDHSWSITGPQLEVCVQHHLKAEELRRQMELAYRERDALLKPISETVRASRDLLMGVYRSSPKKLGEWGFKVSDRPSRTVRKPLAITEMN